MANTHNTVRALVRSILTEEIVSVARGSKDITYDAEFDPQGNIVRGEQLDLSEFPGMEKSLEYARKFTSVDQATLLNKLIEYQEAGLKLGAPLKNPAQAVKIMNAHWRDSISWPTVTRIGRGELAMKLAFATDPSAKEPDFVSDSGVRLSIKYLGPRGVGTAKTGEASEEIAKLIGDIQKILGIKKFPQATWGENDLREILAAMTPAKRKSTITALRSKFSALKQQIVTEHAADGILMLDDANGFYFVGPQTAERDVKLVYVRNSGTRMEFGGPQRGDSMGSLERALVDL